MRMKGKAGGMQRQVQIGNGRSTAVTKKLKWAFDINKARTMMVTEDLNSADVFYV